MPAPHSRALRQFLELSRRGAEPSASGGERAARQLAKAVAGYLPSLDIYTQAGFIEFINLTCSQPSTALDLVGAG